MFEPKHINEAEMRLLLREAYSQDPERSFLAQLARRFRDPAVPRDANNHARLHPLWLVLGLIGLFVLGVFLYFSLLRPDP